MTFLILDFGLEHYDMAKRFRPLNRWRRSDNLKSKIKNLKLVRLVTVIITFVICGVAVGAELAGFGFYAWIEVDNVKVHALHGHSLTMVRPGDAGH
jgi:hypothetical protein